ncbi:MAG: family 16 glycosylhydrolase [Microbacteriaceae bacterium]
MFKKVLLATLLTAGLLGSSLVAPATAASVKLTTAVSIAKYAAVGTKLTAKDAKFSTKPSKITWQWYFNAKAIKKATSKTFTITKAEKGGSVKVVETAYFGKTKKTSTSNVIEVGKLWISGTASLAFGGDNKTLTVTVPQVLPKPAATEFGWLRNNFDILSDGLATRTVSVADAGATLAAKVTFKAPKGYDSATLLTNDVDVASQTRVYKTVWSDEFNGASGLAPNTSFWSPENGDGMAFGNRGWGNNERQWYRLENSSQSGSGALDILATREGASSTKCYYGDCEWYSSKIVTKGKVEFKYGRLEARIKGAPGNGTWGAFWTLGANIDTKLWPWCGEIDVTELVGRMPTSVLGYSHGPVSYGAGRGSTKELGSDWSDGYHTYAVDWLPDQISWYVDGELYGVVDKTDRDWAFDNRHYVILNLAMGGNLGGEIDPGMDSATMKVDYVRFSTINGVGEVFRG